MQPKDEIVKCSECMYCEKMTTRDVYLCRLSPPREIISLHTHASFTSWPKVDISKDWCGKGKLRRPY